MSNTFVDAAAPAPRARPVGRAARRIRIGILRALSLCVALGPRAAIVEAAPGAEEPWRTEIAVDGSAPGPRHEAGAVEVDGRMYLLGGRSGGLAQPVDVYDPVARTWTTVGRMPADLHHFQPVVVGTEIWIVGALTGGFPNETPVADVHAYEHPRRHVADRRAGARAAPGRGSAAAALHGGLIYVLGGATPGGTTAASGALVRPLRSAHRGVGDGCRTRRTSRATTSAR